MKYLFNFIDLILSVILYLIVGIPLIILAIPIIGIYSLLGLINWLLYQVDKKKYEYKNCSC